MGTADRHPMVRAKSSGDPVYGISQDDMVNHGPADSSEDGPIDAAIRQATGGGAGSGLREQVDGYVREQVEHVTNTVREGARSVANEALDRQRAALEASARAAAQKAALVVVGLVAVLGVGYLATRD